MTTINNNSTITANGEYSFEPLNSGDEVLVEWEITAGTATVTPGRVTLSGAFKAVLPLDGTPPVFAATGGDCIISLGNSSKAALKVESAAGGFSMKVCQTKLPR